MSIEFDPYSISVDGKTIGDYACMIERLRGTRVMAQRRGSRQTAAYRHGRRPNTPYFDEKVLPLAITVFPTDASHEVNHPSGPIGHLQGNVDDLWSIFGKRGMIDFRQKIPTSDGGEPPSEVVVECQGYAQVDRRIEIDGDEGAWSMLVELVFPYPFLHELPKITLSAATQHVFTTGGTAPIADMVFTFSGAGTVTYGDYEIGVTEAAVVDVGKREAYVGGELAMDVLNLDVDTPENWMEWPARTEITLNSTVNVAVEYYNARH